MVKKTTKKAKKSHRTKQTRKFDIKTPLMVGLVVLSLGGNVAQIFIHQKLSTDSEDLSWRLNNYRELQNTQIAAVRANCRRINETVYDPLGYYSGVLKDFNSDLSSDYAVNVKLRCRLPALLIAGYINFNDSFEEYENAIKETFTENSYVVKEDAFERVKW